MSSDQSPASPEGLKKYFGTDGIRGEANRDLTPEMALAAGRAIVRALGRKNPLIVVGRDTRMSGKMLEEALVAGILSEGANVYICGVLPTPAIAFISEDIGASAGIVISASHNPYRDNGIKVFGPGGYKLSDKVESEIEAHFEAILHGSSAKREGDPENIGVLTVMDDADERYLKILASNAKCDLSGLRVALDCANGAGYKTCPEIFTRLGAEIETIGTEPDGRNINLGCGSTSPDRLADLVLSWKADIGFALDGDGDRCICVDENGEVRDGDTIMGVAAKYLHEKGLLHPPVVVTTVMSNMGLELTLNSLGIRNVRTRVGDRYVMEEMLSTGALLGGEQSGHIIFREHASTGDGTLTALMVAGIIKDTGESFSSLSSVVKKFPQVQINVRSRSGKRLSPDMSVWGLIKKYEDELGEDGRIVVRSSGTEPVVRVMVEARSQKFAESVAKRIAEALERELAI